MLYARTGERDRPAAAAAGPIGARFLDRAIVQITPSLTPINFGQAAGSSVRVVALTHTQTDTRRVGPSRTGRSRFQSPIPSSFLPLPLSGWLPAASASSSASASPTRNGSRSCAAECCESFTLLDADYHSGAKIKSLCSALSEKCGTEGMK